MYEETGTPNEESAAEETREESTSSEDSAGDQDWKHSIGDSYRRWASWLSEEIDQLDRLGREKLNAAKEEINERFPAEDRKRLLESAETEIYEFLGELKSLGNRIRSTPPVSKIEQKGAEAIRSSASKVRDWAGHVEEKFAATESDSGGEPESSDEDDGRESAD